MDADTAAPSRWLLVQRADADPEDRDRVDALHDHLGDHARVARTEAPEQLDALIDDLDDDLGLVVCGGDGSMHVAANRVDRRGRTAETTVALFPAGTGNDLAHSLQLPWEPDEMAALLRSGHVRPLDLLEVGDDDVAVNALHAGIGVDAAERSAGLPEGLGALAYPLGALLAGVAAQGFPGEVLVDGDPVRALPDEALLMVLVSNGGTIGGGHRMAPHADPHDGRLEVLVCQATGVAARAAFGLAVTRGTHLDRDDVAHASGTEVRVRGQGLSWNVDGELWTDRTIDDLTVRVRPRALPFVVPAP
jgi:diacylglycerol kinase (ATP)